MKGALRAALRLLGRRIGLPGPALQVRLQALPPEALEDLVEAALDFSGPRTSSPGSTPAERPPAYPPACFSASR